MSLLASGYEVGTVQRANGIAFFRNDLEFCVGDCVALPVGHKSYSDRSRNGRCYRDVISSGTRDVLCVLRRS